MSTCGLFPSPTVVAEQQPINVLSAGFVDESLRKQLSVLLVLQSVATFSDSSTHNTMNHETFGCNVLLSACLEKPHGKQYLVSLLFGRLRS